MKKVCVIVGPTASGKTALSLEIAKRLNGEIINGDAMQVYRGMDIGTAKITEEEMMDIAHHRFSFVNPSESYSIYQHQQNVRESIDEITERGKLPIIVGGSGLYIQAVVYDYQLNHVESEIADNPLESNEVVWQKLLQLDRTAAEQIHPNNRKRVLRAIGRAQSGDIKSESDNKAQNQQLLYDVFAIGIEVERQLLQKRIENRVDTMLALGLENEVRALFKNDVSETARVAIGYREWIPYFEDAIPIEKVREEIIVHTRQLAKKQMTWFYNQRLPIHWIELPDDERSIQFKLNTWIHSNL